MGHLSSHGAEDCENKHFMWNSLSPQLLVPTNSGNTTHFRCGQESLD